MPSRRQFSILLRGRIVGPIARRSPGSQPRKIAPATPCLGRRLVQTCRSSASRRTGTTTVEMAFALPILFCVLLASIDCTRLNMLRNTVENAAYEGARRGILPGADADSVKAAATAVLQAIGVKNYEIDVSPETIDADTTEIKVEIEVPMANNSWLSTCMACDEKIRKSCTLSREQTQKVDGY